MWLSGFTLCLLIVFLPETSPSNILYRRARRLRKLTGNDKFVTEGELASKEMSGKDIALMTLVRPFTLSLLEPICLCLNMYIALIYGLLYIWFESFPIVFIEIYGFTLGTEGLAFLGILIGVFIILPPFVWYQHKYIEPKFDENGEITPEWRLPPSFFGAFCIPICLFWFGWSSRPDIHWIMPIIGSAWFSFGAFLLFNSVLNYLSDAYPEYAASVLAGNDFFRSMFGAGFVSTRPSTLQQHANKFCSHFSHPPCTRILVLAGRLPHLPSYPLHSFLFLSCSSSMARQSERDRRTRDKTCKMRKTIDICTLS